jgi:dTDP-glucose pyrophosphorylase
LIGILPCAGTATRIHGLPKFLLPVPGGYLLQRHISGMRAAGCEQVLIGGNPNNLELLFDYGDGAWCYIAEPRETMTQTVLSLRDHIPDLNAPILFSMPDTYIPNASVYQSLQSVLNDGAGVAVALFKARPGQHTQGGVCSILEGQVVGVIDKPETLPIGARHIWGALAWTPVFWQHLDPADPHVGYGLPRAIAAGLDVRAVVCDGGYWDCGTPERYFECIRSISTQPEVV